MYLSFMICAESTDCSDSLLPYNNILNLEQITEHFHATIIQYPFPEHLKL
uniref:Uncharacterized protein n=1 Tax=Arundo donax TaxID=35708 RepID=A0A0A9BDC9_ARUDO